MKNRLLGIVQSARHVNSGSLQKEHSLRQSEVKFADSERFSAASIRAEYQKLNRHIHRFKCKIEKSGAFMRMTKVPFESKYRRVLAEAKDYIRQVYEFRER